jgi:hypothetical protein
MNGTRTRLNLPSKKLFEIFQKLGNEETITSETFFTMSQIACQTSWPPACAEYNGNDYKKLAKGYDSSPTTTSGALLSSAARHT